MGQVNSSLDMRPERTDDRVKSIHGYLKSAFSMQNMSKRLQNMLMFDPVVLLINVASIPMYIHEVKLTGYFYPTVDRLSALKTPGEAKQLILFRKWNFQWHCCG